MPSRRCGRGVRRDLGSDPRRAMKDEHSNAGARRRAPGAPVTIAVVGGAGAMGRITVRDLVETAGPSVRIVVADHDEAAAKRLARASAARARAGAASRVTAIGVDVTR